MEQDSEMIERRDAILEAIRREFGFVPVVNQVVSERPDVFVPLSGAARSILENGDLDRKTRYLCAVSAATAIGGEYCVDVQMRHAKEAGATKDEVFEARGKNLTLEDGRNVLLLPFDGYEIIGRLKKQSIDGTTFDTIENAARDNKVFEYIDIRDERLMHGSVVDAVNAVLDEQDKEGVDRDVAIGLLYNSIARYTAGSMRLLDEINEAWCPEVYILGQASKDQYLNSLIAMHGSRTVFASAGFDSSTFAFLYQMIRRGECSHDDVVKLVRNTSGLSTFRRME